jgi:NAD(P)-dependent dehydrogenase (short-subunit alcohol dehydrogenase family)
VAVVAERRHVIRSLEQPDDSAAGPGGSFSVQDALTQTAIPRRLSPIDFWHQTGFEDHNVHAAEHPAAGEAAGGVVRHGYRRMIDLCPTGRAGTPDEVGNVGAPLMSADGGFITGSDLLMDGGVTASYWLGELAPK